MSGVSQASSRSSAATLVPAKGLTDREALRVPVSRDMMTFLLNSIEICSQPPVEGDGLTNVGPETVVPLAAANTITMDQLYEQLRAHQTPRITITAGDEAETDRGKTAASLFIPTLQAMMKMCIMEQGVRCVTLLDKNFRRPSWYSYRFLWKVQARCNRGMTIALVTGIARYIKAIGKVEFPE